MAAAAHRDDRLGRRGEQLLLVLRHAAAALDELPPATVAAWIHVQDLRPAFGILSRAGRLGDRFDALRQIPQASHAAVWAMASRLLGGIEVARAGLERPGDGLGAMLAWATNGAKAGQVDARQVLVDAMYRRALGRHTDRPTRGGSRGRRRPS